MKKRSLFFKNLLSIMRSNNSLLYRICHIMNLLEDLRGSEGQLSLMTTRFILAKKFKWRVIPPLLKKPWDVLIHPNGLRLWKIKWDLWVKTKFVTYKKFLKERK
jgi:hypothetical protein